MRVLVGVLDREIGRVQDTRDLRPVVVRKEQELLFGVLKVLERFLQRLLKIF